jgi:hypothetical protein
MRDNLKRTQIAALMHLLVAVENRKSGSPVTVNDDDLDPVLALLASEASTDYPEQRLAGASRDWLVSALTVAAVKLEAARKVGDALEAENARLVAENARLEALHATVPAPAPIDDEAPPA